MASRAMRFADRIGDSILKGVLAPGARLEEPRLAALSGLSGDEVRQALDELCARGLARRVEGGAVVGQPDPVVLLDQFEALGEIQALCAGLAARRAPLAEVLAAEELVLRMQDADLPAYRALVDELHDRICRMGRNVELARIAAGLRRRVAVGSGAAVPALANRRDWWLEEHRALLDAIAERNETLAVTVMRGHLRAAAREVLFMAEPGRPPGDGAP